jgi:hypothetical protein
MVSAASGDPAASSAKAFLNSESACSIDLSRSRINAIHIRAGPA